MEILPIHIPTTVWMPGARRPVDLQAVFTGQADILPDVTSAPFDLGTYLRTVPEFGTIGMPVTALVGLAIHPASVVGGIKVRMTTVTRQVIQTDLAIGDVLPVQPGASLEIDRLLLSTGALTLLAFFENAGALPNVLYRQLSMFVRNLRPRPAYEAYCQFELPDGGTPITFQTKITPMTGTARGETPIPMWLIDRRERDLRLQASVRNSEPFAGYLVNMTWGRVRTDSVLDPYVGQFYFNHYECGATGVDPDADDDMLEKYSFYAVGPGDATQLPPFSNFAIPNPGVLPSIFGGDSDGAALLGQFNDLSAFGHVGLYWDFSVMEPSSVADQMIIAIRGYNIYWTYPGEGGG
jgi:hypothetical protein